MGFHKSKLKENEDLQGSKRPLPTARMGIDFFDKSIGTGGVIAYVGALFWDQ